MATTRQDGPAAAGPPDGDDPGTSARRSRSAGDPAPAGGADDEAPDRPSLDAETARKLDDLNQRLVVDRNAEIHGLFQILGSKRRLFMVNFLAGLSRGVGFFLGATLVGGLVIGAMAFTIDKTMATLGYQDVTFKSLVRTFARKAVEAQSVFEEVKAEQEAEQEAEQPPGAKGSEVEPPAGADEPPPEDR